MNLTFALEIVGTVAFAFVGAEVAIHLGLDLLGIYISGITTAIGGGMIRDLLLGNTPPLTFRNPAYALWAAATVTVLVLVYKQAKSHRFFALLQRMILVADAVGLGIFTVVGIDTALACGFANNGFLSVFVGVLTGVGGGILRDTMVNRTPVVLSRDIYATASIIGGILYYLVVAFAPGIPKTASMLFTVALIAGVRLIAVRKNLQLPRMETQRTGSREE